MVALSSKTQLKLDIIEKVSKGKVPICQAQKLIQKSRRTIQAMGYYDQTKLELHGDDFQNKIGIARVDEIIDMQARFTLVVNDSFYELGSDFYNLGPFNASFEKKPNHVYLKPFEVSNDSLSIRSTTLNNEPLDTPLVKTNGQYVITGAFNVHINGNNYFLSLSSQ